MSFFPSLSGVVFDAYGTLFDVYAVEAMLESCFPGLGRAIALRWRDKQIDYSRLRRMSGRYADFWSITVHALEYACEFEQVSVGEEARGRLLALYERLPPHAEVPEALEAIAAR